MGSRHTQIPSLFTPQIFPKQLTQQQQIKSGEVVFDEEENRLEKSTFDFKIPVISRQNSAKVFPEIDYESQEVRKKKLRTKLKLSLTGEGRREDWEGKNQK